jgi:hypothetical protein
MLNLINKYLYTILFFLFVIHCFVIFMSSIQFSWHDFFLSSFHLRQEQETIKKNFSFFLFLFPFMPYVDSVVSHSDLSDRLAVFFITFLYETLSIHKHRSLSRACFFLSTYALHKKVEAYYVYLPLFFYLRV